MRNPFRKPTALQLAVEELEDAQRELLSASSAAEYAQAMMSYHTQRIERLQQTIISTERARPATSAPSDGGTLSFKDESEF